MLIGVLLVFIPPLNHLIGQFDPELFMGLFVAPLFFFEGQSIRMNKVARNWHLIVSLTVVMILFCALAATCTARLFVGNLALAVILGALSTPTDAKQPDLTPEERTIFFQAYRLAFQTELDLLSEIEQQDQQVEAAIVRLSREVLIAEILIFDNTND